MIGKTLSHYKVLEEIGRGGMGVVYRALDTTLGREVALKVLGPGAAREPEQERRLKQEARAAASLAHPAVSVVYEIDEAEGATFIAMELVRGTAPRRPPRPGPRSSPSGPSTSPSRSPRGWPRPTPAASCTATSSRRTSCSRNRGTRRSSTSAWPSSCGRARPSRAAPTPPPGATPTPAASSAPPPTCRPSRCGARRWTRAATSSPSGRCSTRCSRGSRPSGARPASRPCTPCSRSRRRGCPSAGTGAAGPVLQRVLDRCLAKAPDDRYASATELLAELREARRRLEAPDSGERPAPAEAPRGASPPPRPRRPSCAS